MHSELLDLFFRRPSSSKTFLKSKNSKIHPKPLRTDRRDLIFIFEILTSRSAQFERSAAGDEAIGFGLI